jgi:hypothetical protein
VESYLRKAWERQSGARALAFKMALCSATLQVNPATWRYSPPQSATPGPVSKPDTPQQCEAAVPSGLIFEINKLRLARYEAHAPRTVPEFNIKVVRVLIGKR